MYKWKLSIKYKLIGLVITQFVEAPTANGARSQINTKEYDILNVSRVQKFNRR